MSYFPGNTTLIARRGYGPMGDASSCGPDQEWDSGCVFAGITGQCVPKGTAGHASGCSYPGTLDKIGSFLKGIGSGVISAYSQQQQAKGAAAAYQSMQPSATPAWVMPVAIGGVAIAAVLLLRGGKRKNPARGRRRRRRRSTRRYLRRRRR
jgi:hypothetical protein